MFARSLRKHGIPRLPQTRLLPYIFKSVILSAAKDLCI